MYLSLLLLLLSLCTYNYIYIYIYNNICSIEVYETRFADRVFPFADNRGAH